MKIDPYKHKERYLKWREETKDRIEGLGEYNFQLLKKYLLDMERGMNIAIESSKGPRGFSRLNTIKDRFMVFSRNFKEIYNLDKITDISEDQLIGFFADMKNGTIKTDYHRIKKVNDKTCNTFSDMDKLLQSNSEEESWLKNGLTAFYRKEKQPTIVLPYAKFLAEQIDGQDIFDNNSARSQRDIKRLLALTCAMTYLFQEQRKKVEHNGELFIISEVEDFIKTLTYSAEFFNQSYSGLDGRLTEVLKVMKELGEDWIARDEIQNKLDISRNTIKGYCNTLAGEGLIEGKVSGEELNEETGLIMYNKNKVYYKRCQRGVKKPIIRCEISKLKEFLTIKTQQLADTSSQRENTRENGVNKQAIKTDQDKQDSSVSNKIDTISLTPFSDNNFEDNKIPAHT